MDVQRVVTPHNRNPIVVNRHSCLTKEHVECSSIDDATIDVITPDTNDQIVEAIVVDVACSQRFTKPIADLTDTRYTWFVLENVVISVVAQRDE